MDRETDGQIDRQTDMKKLRGCFHDYAKATSSDYLRENTGRDFNGACRLRYFLRKMVVLEYRVDGCVLL